MIIFGRWPLAQTEKWTRNMSHKRRFLGGGFSLHLRNEQSRRKEIEEAISFFLFLFFTGKPRCVCSAPLLCPPSPSPPSFFGHHRQPAYNGRVWVCVGFSREGDTALKWGRRGAVTPHHYKTPICRRRLERAHTEKKTGKCLWVRGFIFRIFRVGRSFAAASLPFFLFLLLPSFCLRSKTPFLLFSSRYRFPFLARKKKKFFFSRLARFALLLLLLLLFPYSIYWEEGLEWHANIGGSTPSWKPIPLARRNWGNSYTLSLILLWRKFVPIHGGGRSP